LGSGVTAVALLRAFRDILSWQDTSLRPALLSCGWFASRSSAPRPRALLVRRSHLAVRPPRGVRSRGNPPESTRRYPSSGFHPAPESDPGIPVPLVASVVLSCVRLTASSGRVYHTPRTVLNRSLEVLRPHSATQSCESTNPGLPRFPVMLRPRTYHVPRRLSPRRISPVSFNRARSRGSPFRA
jgi:hypothetical protein